MKRPQLVPKGSVTRMLQAADGAWKRCDFQQCFELLERASRLDPANAKILQMLGQRYGTRCDYAAAERCFEKVVRLAAKKTAALAATGQLCIGFRSPHLAERYYRQALEQKDAPPETFAQLAGLYERLRRLEEASKLVEQALQLDSGCAMARLISARLDRQAGNLAEAERVLRPILNSAGAELRIRGYYELGAILDRQGRYDEAMTAFLAAKAILRPAAQQMLATVRTKRAMIPKRHADLTPELFQRWLDLGPQLQPARRLALLAGHPRSGTTLLEQVLDSHTDIISVEESPVFMDDVLMSLQAGLPENPPLLATLEAAHTAALQQSRELYFRNMELHLNEPVGSRLMLDKNPSATLFIPAFVRVFPEIKILMALRDPRDVVLSCFMQCYVPINAGSAAYLSLEDVSDGYVVLAEGWRTFSAFLKNPWLEVRYEDMVDDLESVARRTLDFLGVSWNPDVLKFNEHARQKVVRSPTYADVTKPVFKTARGRWRNYQKYLEPYLERLEPFVKAFGYE